MSTKRAHICHLRTTFYGGLHGDSRSSLDLESQQEHVGQVIGGPKRSEDTVVQPTTPCRPATSACRRVAQCPLSGEGDAFGSRSLRVSPSAKTKYCCELGLGFADAWLILGGVRPAWAMYGEFWRFVHLVAFSIFAELLGNLVTSSEPAGSRTSGHRS